MKILANIISYIFHPLFIPIYLLSTMLFLPVYSMQRYHFDYKIYLLSYVLVIDIILPIIVFMLFKYNKIISNLKIEKANERTKPYIFMFVIYIFTSILFLKIPAMPPIIYGIFIAISVIILIIAILNFFIKASIHAASLSAVCVWYYEVFKTFDINTSIFLILSILICSFVVSSRLYLKVHTQFEVYLGLSVGLITAAIVSMVVL